LLCFTLASVEAQCVPGLLGINTDFKGVIIPRFKGRNVAFKYYVSFSLSLYSGIHRLLDSFTSASFRPP
jgi:hypothetical protein